MNNPYTIEKVVLEILKANEEARNDDMKFYLLVCEAVNPYPTVIGILAHSLFLQ